MPITEKLQTSEQLQQAGLPHAAAVLIAEKIEAAAQATHDTALDRFRGDFDRFRAELRAELAALEMRLTGKIESLRGEVGAVRADLEKSLRTTQTVVVTVVLAAAGLVVAVVGGFGTAILTVLLRR